MICLTHERTFTAIHESGHSVAYCRLGIDQTRVCIVPGNGMEGYNLVSAYVGDAVTALKHVLCALAGYGAAVAREGADTDFNTAAELISAWSLPGTLEEWTATAISFMTTDENIHAVELVTEALLEHETLEADYIGGLVERADGLPEHIWRQYVEWKYPDML